MDVLNVWIQYYKITVYENPILQNIFYDIIAFKVIYFTKKLILFF